MTSKQTAACGTQLSVQGLACATYVIPVMLEGSLHESNEIWLLHARLSAKPNPKLHMPAANRAYSQGAAPKSFTSQHKVAVQAQFQGTAAAQTKLVQVLKVGNDTAKHSSTQPSAHEDLAISQILQTIQQPVH